MKIYNLKFKIKNFARGFTIIELLVVMAVVSIISTITLVNYRAGEKRKRVDIAADTIISALRLGQTYALSGKNTSNPNTACRVPQYYFVTVTYQGTIGLFAQNNCNTTDTVQVFSLPQGIRIKPTTGLSVDGTFSTLSLMVRTLPPYGRTSILIDGVTTVGTFTSASIVVESPDAGVSKTVNVDGVSGRIGE